MAEASATIIKAEALISDPSFRRGYEDCWASREWRIGADHNYHRGYNFALWMFEGAEEKLCLMRGGFANSDAVNLLMHAIKERAVV